MPSKTREFILLSKKIEAENITSLFFKSADGESFDFVAGQYVSVSLPSISDHSKCYTISSPPSEKFICLTVKRQGEFSSALIDSIVGDKLVFSGPFGRFYPEENCGDIVFIAGGIGVTPFFSIVKDKINPHTKRIQSLNAGAKSAGIRSGVGVNSKPKPRISLFYSNKTISGIAFFDELNKLAGNKVIETLVYFLTQEKNTNPLISEYSRINKELLKKYLVHLEQRNYYLCGSIQFVNTVWKDLKESGVPEENIFTESFY